MRAPAELMQRRLTQARRLLAIAQTGLHYTTGAFDRERYQELLGIAQAQLAEVAEISTEEIVQLFGREEGYANPKMDVRCAVFDDAGRVLLVREAADGRWSLPGGWADIGASPAENAMREVREESGYTSSSSGCLRYGIFRSTNIRLLFSTSGSSCFSGKFRLRVKSPAWKRTPSIFPHRRIASVFAGARLARTDSKTCRTSTRGACGV